MKLRDRLERQIGPVKRRPDRPTESRDELERQDKLATLRRRLAELDRGFRSPARQTEPIVGGDDLLSVISGGREVQTHQGPCFVATNTRDLDDRHGNQRLQEFLCTDGKVFARITADPILAGLVPDRCLFLDIETTGLSGGTGCYAFLIGTGFVEGQQFVVQQIFMRDYSEEAASLCFFSELLSRFDYLVTFNGKSFDVGLLATRLVMNRMENLLSRMPHLDLLHPSKRIYKYRLPDCRLATLEERVLGLRRHDDIPGEEIPPLYFRYVRSQNGGLVKKVFEHNTLDVISMASLVARLQSLWLNPLQPEAAPDDLLGLGLFLSNREELHRALAPLGVAQGRATTFQLRSMARRRLIQVLKRLRRYENAAMECRRWMEDETESFDPFPYEELAKHLEHRLHDCRGALSFTEMALQKCDDVGWRAALEHRCQRLLRKLSNAGEESLEPG
jgi:uncharacterized protein YprB with RNaseH-like and TPR domain